jgi:hypothetical protein
MNLENKKLSDNSNSARKNYDFMEVMNNPATWKATVLDVKNYSYFSCKLGITPHPDAGVVDCAQIDNKFKIINNDNGSIVYDQTEKDAADKLVGFTAEGTKCFGFDAVNGNDNCPTHYQVTWDLPCLRVANCKEPMAVVAIKQITRYSTKTGLNSDKVYSLNVNLPQAVEIAPRDSTYMVNINDPNVTLDVLKTDYAVDTFNLKIKTVSSSVNSTVSIVDNKIVYAPKANYYGVDKIYYTVEQNLFDKVTKADGVIWVKVMTPFTWVGDGQVVDTNSFTGRKWYSLFDKMNWCGQVVNNKCNHFNANPDNQTNWLSDSELKNASLVFNEMCSNCHVLFKIPSGHPQTVITLNAMEVTENFAGELKQVDHLKLLTVRNSYNRNANEPALLYSFWLKGGTFIGANSKASLLTDEVFAENKYITFERNGWTGNGPRIITRGSLNFNTYGHFSVEGGKFYAPESLELVSGYNQITNKNYFFNQNGRVTIYPRWAGGNMLDAPNVVFNEFAYNGTGGFDHNIMGSIYVKDLFYYQAGYENQLRGLIGENDGHIYVSRNMYMHGGGGFMVNGWGAEWDYLRIEFNGSTDQYIYSNLDMNGNKDRTKMGRLPILVVNKPAGVLHIKGDIGFTTGIDYKAGDIRFYDDEEKVAGDKQMVEFSSTWNRMWVKNTSGKELVFPNFEFTPQCAYMKLETDFRVAGDFIQDKRKYNPQCSGYPFGPQTHKILVEGDIYATSGTNEYDSNGVVTLELTGNKNQTIYGNSNSSITNNVSNLSAADMPFGINPTHDSGFELARGYLPHIDIRKSGGSVKVQGAVGFVGRFKVAVGNLASVDASEAIISFANTNDCCAPGYALLNLDGMESKRLRVKGLNVQRALNLQGTILEITHILNLPNSYSYNNGVLTDGTIHLYGDWYYNDSFDRAMTDVNRAKIIFKGGSTQTIYATMLTGNRAVGTFDIEIDKRTENPYVVGKVSLNCQTYDPSVFQVESLKIEYGNLELNNCNFKATKSINIVRGDLQEPSVSEGGGVIYIPHENGRIHRGAVPGVFQYGSLTNNGSIVPNVVAGP